MTVTAEALETVFRYVGGLMQLFGFAIAAAGVTAARRRWNPEAHGFLARVGRLLDRLLKPRKLARRLHRFRRGVCGRSRCGLESRRRNPKTRLSPTASRSSRPRSSPSMSESMPMKSASPRSAATVSPRTRRTVTNGSRPSLISPPPSKSSAAVTSGRRP